MDEYLKSVTDTDAVLNVKSLENIFKKGGWRIFSGKGYTSTGVSASVISVIGRNGIEDIHEVAMTDEEREAFYISVDSIRQAAKSEGIIG